MSDAWGGGEGSSVIWVSQYHSFLFTDSARECIPDFSQQLHAAEQQLAQEANSDDETDNDEQLRQDDWMQLCQRFSLPSSLEADDYDWAEDAKYNASKSCPRMFKLDFYTEASSI